MEEIVAKAIYESRAGRGRLPWPELPSDHREPYLSDARAAMKAMNQPAASKGYDRETEMALRRTLLGLAD